jgi:hypothetical protein
VFNSDQRDWTASLARMPLETKCGCGWDRLGECYTCQQTVMRLCGVSTREVASWPDGGRTDYILPGGVVADWAGCRAWLEKTAPNCFAPPAAPAGWAMSGPWVSRSAMAGSRCPTCKTVNSLLARVCVRKGAQRFMSWCRTCGTTELSSPVPEEDEATPPTAGTLESLMTVVPQTCGEAVAIWGETVVNCPGYEWDNRTTWENAAWLLKRITIVYSLPPK